MAGGIETSDLRQGANERRPRAAEERAAKAKGSYQDCSLQERGAKPCRSAPTSDWCRLRPIGRGGFSAICCVGLPSLNRLCGFQSWADKEITAYFYSFLSANCRSCNGVHFRRSN